MTVSVPTWLLAGLALGGAFTIVVGTVFALGERLYPHTPPASDGYVGGEARRRAEIRQYLVDVGERFAEDHPVAGEPVAFYLPERRVAITFDAEAYFRIQRTDVHPVLCEHEMPGHHLGFRLPFEVPEFERETDADVESSVRSAFRALGLTVDASTEEVRAAYRERVKEVHPDHGGDEDQFKRVREAYVTAKDHSLDVADAA